MEVTKTNFEVIFPKFKELLAACDFYAVDLEMTGINPPKTDVIPSKAPDLHPLVAPVNASIFPNKDAAARRYNIIQMGVTLFQRATELPPAALESPGKRPQEVYVDDDDDSEVLSKSPPPAAVDEVEQAPPAKTIYTVRPFNFYLFPDPSSTKDVHMNPETVSEFLTKHGMDFTKWISQGIPYVTVEDGARIRSAEAETPLDKAAKIGDADPAFASFLKKLKALAQKRNTSDFVEVPFLSPAAFSVFPAVMSSLGVKKVPHDKGDGKQRWKIVVDPEATISAGSNGGEAAQERAVGALKLWEALLQCKRPLIIHNGMSDLLFLYHAFNSAPLKDYADWKLKMNKFFPLIFDTRTLATLPELFSTVDVVQNLQGQFKYMHSKYRRAIGFDFPLGFDAFHPSLVEQSGRGAHEAAYDAFMTGGLYLCLRKQLGDETLVKYRNLIAVYGSIITSNLVGEDKVLHNAPIIFIHFSENVAAGAQRIDQVLRGTGFQGRVMASTGGSAVFCSDEAMEGGDLDGLIKKANALVAKALDGGSVQLLYPGPGAGAGKATSGKVKTK
jgi:hypothetical protein